MDPGLLFWIVSQHYADRLVLSAIDCGILTVFCRSAVRVFKGPHINTSTVIPWITRPPLICRQAIGVGTGIKCRTGCQQRMGLGWTAVVSQRIKSWVFSDNIGAIGYTVTVCRFNQ